MDLSDFLDNCCKDCVFKSDIPEESKKEPCLLGIDEAGRGPVLGPMVYGIAYYPIKVKSVMEKQDFADSKTLTESKREEIFNKILNNKVANFGWMTMVLSPVTISNSMFKRTKYNLNSLSHDTAMGLIQRAIDEGVNVEEVYVDTVGPEAKYKAKLSDRFPTINFTVAQKADSKYSVVSAASICAKVIRDRIIANWRFREDVKNIGDYGSGYPADPKTKAFLQKNMDPVFGYPSFVRFSWSTADSILESKAIECEWDEVEEKPTNNNKRSMTQFVPKKKKQNTFFENRCLKRLTDFSKI
ncbi:ribonuclease H2 subunit A-like [Panonychus citri]|uniref:ribonuclease H2 subunit A-like n=1 Tax=Panonychus citri TaxID=50023 RepID=UPI00230738A0|nr:ribonuclease H2 subunit A-like [Panonychus citri]